MKLNYMEDIKKEYIKKLKDYPESARSIHLHLQEFCDQSMPYPAMIAFAARSAGLEIDRLRELTEQNKTDKLNLQKGQEPESAEQYINRVCSKKGIIRTMSLQDEDSLYSIMEDYADYWHKSKSVRSNQLIADPEKWVSVKDRLPEESGYFWCYAKNSPDRPAFQCKAKYDKESGKWIKGVTVSVIVSHHQNLADDQEYPLPPAPGEANTAKQVTDKDMLPPGSAPIYTHTPDYIEKYKKQ